MKDSIKQILEENTYESDVTGNRVLLVSIEELTDLIIKEIES